MKVEVIHDDAWDWEIAVVNGKKIAEGHSLSTYDWQRVLTRLGVDFEEVEVEDIQESKYYQSAVEE